MSRLRTVLVCIREYFAAAYVNVRYAITRKANSSCECRALGLAHHTATRTSAANSGGSGGWRCRWLQPRVLSVFAKQISFEFWAYQSLKAQVKPHLLFLRFWACNLSHLISIS